MPAARRMLCTVPAFGGARAREGSHFSFSWACSVAAGELRDGVVMDKPNWKTAAKRGVDWASEAAAGMVPHGLAVVPGISPAPPVLGLVATTLGNHSAFGG